MAGTKVIELDLKDIVLDKEIYPRNSTFWQTSYQYSQEMKSGARFPMIVVAEQNGKYVLIDGLHRKDALKILKIERTQVEVLYGLTKEQMYEESLRRNIAHGLALSPYDKRIAILKLRNLKYPLNEISKIVQIPMDNIENFISQRLVNSITGDTIGESFIVKSGLKHLAGKEVSINKMQSLKVLQDNISIQSQISILRQVHTMLEENLFDRKDELVTELLKSIKKLI